MSTTRIISLHVGNARIKSRVISFIIDYVENPQKTDGSKLITGLACGSRPLVPSFLLSKRQYIAVSGLIRGKGDVNAYHVRHSFMPAKITSYR